VLLCGSDQAKLATAAAMSASNPPARVIFDLRNLLAILFMLLTFLLMFRGLSSAS
jgi:hypothetical protein